MSGKIGKSRALSIPDITHTAVICVVIIAAFAVYLLTMAPSFKLDDSPEVASAAWGLSLMHPPGYPLYTMAGKIASLFPAGSVAFRINLLSAALGCLSVYLISVLSGYVFRGKGNRNTAAAAITAGLAAFSYIFWNQAYEAKGGIYMLNLALMICVIYFALQSYEKGGKKYAYMLCYVYGLSFANHWQTMVLLAAIPAAALFHARAKLRARGILLCAAFFFAGLTPYIFSLIRHDALSYITWADLRSVQGFLDYVLRRRYSGSAEPFTAQVILRQAWWYLELFYRDFGLFFVLMFLGITPLYRMNKNAFMAFMAVAAPVTIAVVLFSRPFAYLAILNDIFLLPVQVAAAFFIVAGILRGGEVLKSVLKPYFYAACAIAFVFTAAASWMLNDSSRNFIGYDYAMNTLKTIKQGSLYMAEGDYNIFPMMYMLGPGDKRHDITFLSVADLGFDAGIRRVNTNLKITLPSSRLDVNIRAVVDSYMGRLEEYRNSPSPIFDTAQVTRYPQIPEGILIRVREKYGVTDPSYFDLYSYRGIRQYFLANPDVYLPVSWYFWSMYNQARYLSESGMPDKASALYEKALLFPGDVPKKEIGYELSKYYRVRGDSAKELKWLKYTAEADPDFHDIFGRLGLLLYGSGDRAGASNYALKIKELGLNDTDALLLLEKTGIGRF